jgi:rod shape-determining protein MreB
METLSQTPPELAAVYNTGIYLAGGGSMLRGLDKRISQRTCLFTLLKIHYEQL